MEQAQKENGAKPREAQDLSLWESKKNEKNDELQNSGAQAPRVSYASLHVVGRHYRRPFIVVCSLSALRRLTACCCLPSQGCETVGDQELIAARMYSGPMYYKYNAVLRALNDKARNES